MRICELRKFTGDFVVFINKEEDIQILSSDKRFSFHASYTDCKTGKCIGKEFRFKDTCRTLKDAKRLVEELLHDQTTRQG